MDTSTGVYPLAALQDTSAKPRPAHASKDDGTPQPNVKHPSPNSNNCIILIQNNFIAQGGTINVFSSNCNGSTVVNFNDAAPTAEPLAAFISEVDNDSGAQS